MLLFEPMIEAAQSAPCFWTALPAASKLCSMLERPDAAYAAVVCHPHPLFGGTLHNKVVFHAMKALNGFGFPVLRFNFRGTGLSQGEHDHGMAKWTTFEPRWIGWIENFNLPMIFAGFSFGAAVGLRAACPMTPG